ncbi:hypothetical protein [Planctobacterium marinum]|uniref:Uncharacterized protein n=1 Tax=Planctobacterium marinum TaxID=1631968 RepID=A0AA48HUG7_9ALTE|nr:hypothetical protein MACH26_03310 [Planctobacterium marinum]
MDILHNQQNKNSEKAEDKAIFETLRTESHLPGMSDADAIFLMQMDVPDAILKKLRAH